MQQRLAARDGDDGRTERAQLVDCGETFRPWALGFEKSSNSLQVGTGQVATAHGDDVRQHWG